jgi:hypothetical protein
MSDLLDAVDALTKPIIEHFSQKDDDGKFVKAHTITRDPLLTQLRDAVNPSANNNAGSASLQSARSIIDSDALLEYSKMASAIGDWCRQMKVERTRDPIVDLRRWYVAYDREGDQPDWYRNELQRWAHVIRNHLEPPKRMEVTTPCPVCGKRTWTDAEGNELLFPIMVEYKATDEGSIKPNALCRACDTVWRGYDAVAELADELNQESA